jgi:hypothetical protein
MCRDYVVLVGMAKTPKPEPTFSAESRSVFESRRALVERDAILEAGRRLGMIQRDRKLDFPALVESTLLADWPIPRMQTSIFANSGALARERVAPSSFSDRFSMPSAELRCPLRGQLTEQRLYDSAGLLRGR